MELPGAVMSSARTEMAHTTTNKTATNDFIPILFQKIET